MDFKDLNGKLENALDVIMEHFSETEDRLSDLELQIIELRIKLEEAG